jgi:hypothetical protein
MSEEDRGSFVFFIKDENDGEASFNCMVMFDDFTFFNDWIYV